MLQDHTFNAEEYEAAVERERVDRTVRVRRFIAEHDETEIDELFDAMRDLLDLREQTEQVCLSRYFKGVHGILGDIEANLRDQ